MKTPMIFATALGLMAFVSHAHADDRQLPVALGAGAAHLAAAQGARADADSDYVLRHDPTGAPMCFDAAGAKAPLSACDGGVDGDSSSIEHIVAFDPTGAPMCFDVAGSKAPLSACSGTLEAKLGARGAQIAAR